MAYAEIGKANGDLRGVTVYIGASGDSKPTGVVIGSKVYEYDTKAWYITHDGTTWTAYVEES